MKGKLSLKINFFHVLEIDCSRHGCPTDDSPWREFILLTPTLKLYRSTQNEFGELYSTYGFYIPTIVEFSKEAGIMWGFTFQILGFGVQFYKQVGY